MLEPAIAHQYFERTLSQQPCSLSLSIEENDCLAVAQSLIQSTGQPVCVLNMANPIYVGGDYLHGRGQEESLIHRTNLLDSLIQLAGVKPGTVCNPYKYQLPNCLSFSGSSGSVGFGEFTCVYSSGITVHSLNNDQPLGEQAFTINIISSAAYNLSNDDAFIERGFYLAGTVFKILNQLRTAKTHGQRHLVLGAFGCGAFQNDPEFIAELYHSIIHEFEFQGSFDTICFAIKSTYDGQINYNYSVFSQEFTRSPKLLYDLISEVFPLRKKNPMLNSMLVPFDTISSAQELFFLASRLISNELNKLAHFPQRNEHKIQFYTHLFKFLQAQPNEIRERLASALDSPMCQALTPTSGFFKGVKSSLIKKLETLLNKTPITISGFKPAQTQLAEEAIQNYILPRSKEFLACCEEEQDKEISCFMLYVAALKDKKTLLQELENRYVGLEPVHNLLLAINALCLGQSDNQLYYSVADSHFFSGTPQEKKAWMGQIAKNLGDYVAVRLTAFLEINYPSYFNKEDFEWHLKQKAQNQDHNHSLS